LTIPGSFCVETEARKNLQHTTSGQVNISMEQQATRNQPADRNCAIRDRHGAEPCKCKSCPLLREAAERVAEEEDPERWDGLS
jgi:hypothetical protein